MTHNALSASYSLCGPTSAIADGITLPTGEVIERIDVQPFVATYRRMVRTLEFDVSELAPVTHFMAVSGGLPVKALPVFVHRRFHGHDLVVRPDSAISQPKDLEGKRVGIRAFTVTTAVWVRHLLETRYGVDLDTIEWIVDDEEHVDDFVLPKNVTKLPTGESIADLFEAGQIDAALRGIGGVGRRGNPTDGWSVQDAAASGEPRQLIEDAGAVAADLYATAGIYPLHKLMVVKDDVVRERPELPQQLYDAFVAAKTAYAPSFATAAETDSDLALSLEVVGEDPFPYGMEANRRTLESLLEFMKSQRMVRADLQLGDLFYDL